MILKKRGKGVYKGGYSAIGLYKQYIKDIGGKEILNSDLISERKLYVSKQLYTLILKEYFSIIADKILEGKIFYLPYDLGEIRVRKIIVPASKLKFSVDYGKTLKENKKVIQFNEHSDGCKYNFTWNFNKKLKFRFNPFRFYAVRKLNRRLSKEIKEKGRDYLF
jgi:hypothetical protein